MLIFSLILSFLSMINSDKNKVIEIPSIFSDNMVLQRNSEVPFWGKADRNTEITINGNWGKSTAATANDTGFWKTTLETPEAGGPYEVTMHIGDSIIQFKNVMIGEVWLCSGQSNMEMPLAGWPPRDTVQNWASEIKNADYPQIRLFTVPRAFSYKKEFNCNGTWQECGPASVSNFSATAYFFGRKLFDELKIPIGLIHSSWGGTPVQSWMSKEYLQNFEEYKTVINNLENSSKDFEKYLAWLNSHPVIVVKNKPEDTKWKNLDFEDDECSEINYPDDSWKVMTLPTLWENTEAGDFDGVVWFRKKIEVPTEWINKDLVLELGPIDDMDRTFINGTLIGGYETQGYWNIDRVYNIPNGIIHNKLLIIAVRVLDNQGGGGIYGSASKMKIYPSGGGDSLSLAGPWKYLQVAEYRDQKFFVFSPKKKALDSKPRLRFIVSDQTPTTLFNAMINPVVPYSIRGAIWYQGEANVGEPGMYLKLFPLMIENWRDVWGRGSFPFYYVQIAPYDYGEDSHSEKLREAQLKSLTAKNTGMVVTLDIGNPGNIHPANKQDVGARLAYWALNKTYNKKIPFSGPLFKSMEVKENKIILTFDYAEKLILNEINGQNNFLIAGQDRIFKKAAVKTEGNTLILFNPEIEKPVAVRYAWSNTAQATLFNEVGLPSSSFRTDDWTD
jgi:sialate O-acetylesterase